MLVTVLMVSSEMLRDFICLDVCRMSAMCRPIFFVFLEVFAAPT